MRKYQNPFKTLTKTEWLILILSILSVTVAFLSVPQKDLLTLTASLIGVVALIFVAKGDPAGQIFSVVFALFYSIVSFAFRYYGEMITYLGMTAPIALVTAVSRFRHPYREDKNEVEVADISLKGWILLLTSTSMVTFIFYFILKYFNTANLFVSTVSIATSFLAAGLTFLRSPLYGLGYGANDIVLIIMWVMATAENISYFPMVVCFVVFLINDCYGFYNWRRIKKKQSADILP